MTRTPPVGIFLENLTGGGAEKIAVRTANAMVAQGRAVDMVLWEAVGPCLAELAPQVNIVRLSKQGRVSAVEALFGVICYLRRAKPAVLFTHLEKPSLLALAAGALVGYRRVVPCVHVDLRGYTSIDHQARRRFLLRLIKIFYPLARTVVAVSEGVADSVRRMMGKKPDVQVIHNGFDFERMAQDMAEAAPHDWLTNKTLPVFIACGRLSEQKGFDVLLRAFALVRRDRPARLIILGQGPLHGVLQTQALELGIADDVAFPGFAANPMAWFHRADVFVMSSRAEGLPNVLTEALFAGAEVVSTDCPSGPAEILQRGEYGDLVAVDDAEGLAAGMGRALDRRAARQEPRTGLSKYLKQSYALEVMVGKYMGIIEEVSSLATGL